MTSHHTSDKIWSSNLAYRALVSVNHPNVTSAASPQDLCTYNSPHLECSPPDLVKVGSYMSVRSQFNTPLLPEAHSVPQLSLSCTSPYFIFFIVFIYFWDYLSFLVFISVSLRWGGRLAYLSTLECKLSISLATLVEEPNNWKLLVSPPGEKDREKSGRWKLKYFFIPGKNR